MFYGLGGLGFLLLVALPPLLFAPDIKDKDFPHSGEVVRMTEEGFVLGGKHKGRELAIVTTASTTYRGDVAVGDFVQVFGSITTPGVITADKVQVLEGPRRREK